VGTTCSRRIDAAGVRPRQRTRRSNVYRRSWIMNRAPLPSWHSDGSGFFSVGDPSLEQGPRGRV
jgi:hypothetical protein